MHTNIFPLIIIPLLSPIRNKAGNFCVLLISAINSTLLYINEGELWRLLTIKIKI